MENKKNRKKKISVHLGYNNGTYNSSVVSVELYTGACMHFHCTNTAHTMPVTVPAPPLLRFRRLCPATGYLQYNNSVQPTLCTALVFPAIVIRVSNARKQECTVLESMRNTPFGSKNCNKFFLTTVNVYCPKRILM